MKYSDDLFQLVKSLTKSEKRYFRLFASRYGGEKNYTRLFDALDAQTEYDDSDLRSQFREVPDVRQFAVAKNYLYGLVLRSLRAYYSQSSPRIRVREMLVSVEILYERGLFKQADRLLRQVRKRIERLDDPYLELAVSEYRQKLSGKSGCRVERLDGIHEERMSIHHRLKELYEYNYLVETMGNICTRFPMRGKEQDVLLNELISHPLLASEPPRPASFNTSKLYLWAHATYHYGRKEFAESLLHVRHLVQLYEDHEDMRQVEQTEYLRVMDNLLILLSHCGEVDEYVRQLGQLRERFGQSPVIQKLTRPRIMNSVLDIYYVRTLSLHCTTGNFEEAMALADEIETYLAEYPGFEGDNAHLYLLAFLSYACFGADSYDAALSYLNRIVDGREPLKSRSAYYSARLLEILLHFDLAHMEFVLARLRSLRTRLKTAGLLGGFEREALSGLEALVNLSGTCNRNDALIRLRTALAPLDDGDVSHAIFHHVDIIAWLDSEIYGTSFGDEVRARATRFNRRAPVPIPVAKA